MGDVSIGSVMSDDTKLEEALARLDGAVQAFEVAVVRAAESGQRNETLQREVSALSDDRSKLAAELDEAKAQSSAQVDVNVQIAARVDGVMQNIRTLLGGT